MPELDRAGEAGDRLEPQPPDQAGVVAGTGGEDQHAVHLLQHRLGVRPEQPRMDTFVHHAFERVGERPRLLVNLFLHVVPVRPKLDGRGARLGHAHRARDLVSRAIHDR